MDTKLFNKTLEFIPKVNKEVIKGVAVKQVGRVETYMDEVWAAISRSFPPNLKYAGSKRCTPEEEFNLLIRTYSSNVYALEPSSIFIMKYRLECTDENGTVHPINVPICLPYVYKGGQLWINGTKYTVSPVLTTNVFSAEGDKLYVQLKIKVPFSRLSHSFYCNNERIVSSVVYSVLHIGAVKHRKENSYENRGVVSPNPTMVHYLLIQYGLTGLFNKLGSRVVVNTLDQLENLDKDKWAICRAHELKPISAKPVWDTPPADVGLAIPLEDLNGENKELLLSIIAGFFYITDHFPERINIQYMDEPRMWKTLLGITYFGKPLSGEGVLIEQINNHLVTLSEYIDVITKMSLQTEGVMVDDIYELFIYIISTMQDKLWHTDPTTLYGKKLQTLQFLLSEITGGITGFMFDLVKLNRSYVSVEEVRNMVKNKIKMHSFFKRYDEHKEIDLISSPCDIFAFEHTTKMIPSSAVKGKSSHVSGLDNPSNLAHASIAEVGSYTNLHGVDATGRGYLNPYVLIADDGTIIRNEKFKPLTDYVQSKLNRK